ncbi:MAG: hypothetical protein J0G29_00935 [Alphaproteobacteria bacterium]|nr:hypothetical protein [Alphaproteobacteria bacterium]OJV47130.1 MAG: hypothetical protein BGO28_01650 [Alphaproteobacteria bacterium 43-37]
MPLQGGGQRSAPPYGWVRGERAKPDDTVSFRVFLKLRNEDKLKEFVDQVSDPKSALYGQYKTLDEIRKIVRPSDEDRLKVKQWLYATGISKETCLEDWDSYICKGATVSDVEQLLNITVRNYRHRSLKQTVQMTEDSIVPPVSVHFLSGLDLYDPTMMPKHSLKTNKAKSALSPSGGSSISKLTAMGSLQGTSGSYTVPITSGAAPVILSILSVTGDSDDPGIISETLVAFYCESGNPSDSTFTNYQWCQNSLNAPSSILLNITQNSAPFFSQTFNLPPSAQGSSFGVNCSSASALYPNAFAPEYQNMVFCSLPVSPSNSFQRWALYNFTVQAQFLSGTPSGVSGYMSIDGTPLDKINVDVINPSRIRSQYGLPSDGCAVSSVFPTIQGVLALDVETSSTFSYQQFLSDWAQFNRDNGITCNSTLTTVGNVESADLGETTLDLEMITALNPQASTVLWYTQREGSTHSLLVWAQSIVSNLPSVNPVAATPPSVWSISYACPESCYGSSQINQMNQYFQMLAGQGVSIFTSSGDWGAGFKGEAGGGIPIFPASSPYVTAVGATSLYSSGGTPFEVVCSAADSNVITSGGGFSSVFPQPSYQQSAVFSYLDSGPGSYVSPSITSNRAYPDIAAFGATINTIQDGQNVYECGTSASSPIVAGVFSLINQARIAVGYPAVGAVNHLLYSMYANGTSAFNDVTQGNNCVGERSYIESSSLSGETFALRSVPQVSPCYTATIGWDPVTGLGSINLPSSSSSRHNSLAAMESGDVC